MKRIVLFAVLCIIVSTSSFGAGFLKRWFWFYSANDMKYHLIITYDPQNKENCSVTTSQGYKLHYIPNPFAALSEGRVGYWPDLFSVADKSRKGEIDIGFAFIVLPNDPLLERMVTQPTLFKVNSSEQYPRSDGLKIYHKVVFISVNKSTISVYLVKTSTGTGGKDEYSVSAIFFNPEKGKEYSLRDYTFRRDFDDGGSGGASTSVNFLHYQFDTRHREYLENTLIDKLVGTGKGLTTSLDLLSKTFWWLKPDL